MSNICYGCMSDKENHELVCPTCSYENIKQYETYYLPQGTILKDTYLIGKVLGHGGFGITYIAKHIETQEIVAIKEYFPGEYATRSVGQLDVIKFTGEPGKRFDEGFSRFFKEGKTLQKYNHVIGIVKALEVFKAHHTAYIVMEYVEGITLEEYLIESGGSIGYESALSIMGPIMDSLKEVHKSGLVHRDISPDNIYITTSGQVKLIDFGAAKQISTHKSKSMSVILKQGYAPEEQYRSMGKQGPWTDVYAVSATLYRMITGEVPIEPMERSIGEDIPKPTAQGLRLPDRIEKAIFKGLSIKAENRYQSILELQNHLLGKTSFFNTLKSRIFKRHKIHRIEKRKVTMRLINIALLMIFSILGFFIMKQNDVRAHSTSSVQSDDNLQNEIRYIVPDVRGFSDEDAAYIFEELNIIVKMIYDYNEDIEKGHVVSQSYVNDYVGENQLIVLTVSKGSKEIITFEDAELENAVRQNINKFDEPVYLGDILDIEVLHAPNKGIDSLIGLESFIHLKEIDLSMNSIVDLSPIMALPNLEVMNLQNNSINSFDVTDALHNVTHLDLSGNKLTSFHATKALNRLEILNCSNNDLTDFSTMSALKSIKNIDISHNQLTRFNFTDGLMSLITLDLSNNQLISMDNLAVLSHIEKLSLQDNDIQIMPDLVALKSLNYLDLSSNQLERVDFDQASDELRYLDLRNNFINTIVSMNGPQALEELYLQHNQLKSLSRLDVLTLVEELNVSYNKINNTSGLHKLKSLRNLDLSHNQLTYLSGLYNLPDLKTVDASYNSLRSNSGISNLASLESMNLSNNAIDSVTMMSNCPNVRQLDMSTNNLTYLRNIYNLKLLESLDLSRNKIVGIYQSLNYNKNLKTLNLYLNNPVKKKHKSSSNFTDLGNTFDLSFIKNLSKLEELNISYINTTSLSYLSGLSDLKKLSISGNPIYNSRNQKIVTELQEQGTVVDGFNSVQGSETLSIGNYQYIYGVIN